MADRIPEPAERGHGALPMHARKPRLLDLFCCAGGAGMGYSRAGFDVVGVDLERQRNYPFPFIQADVFTIDQAWVLANKFDAIHASPSCKGYTALRHAPGTVGAPMLIGETRELLESFGLPWIIENVEDAAWAMRDPVTLCGSMFGLSAQGCWLKRHRLFEASFALSVPACEHDDSRPVIGVYGGHARRRAAKHGGRGTKDVWAGGHRAAASEALGIDWATLNEMSEAIPPAYTQFLGRQLLAEVRARQALSEAA